MTIQEAINGFEMDNALLAGSGETGVIERNILAIDALRKAAADRWIPVSERKPIDGARVVATIQNNRALSNATNDYLRFVEVLFFVSGMWVLDCEPLPDHCEVVAWYDAPAPYKEENNDR